MSNVKRHFRTATPLVFLKINVLWLKIFFSKKNLMLLLEKFILFLYKYACLICTVFFQMYISV